MYARAKIADDVRDGEHGATGTGDENCRRSFRVPRDQKRSCGRKQRAATRAGQCLSAGRLELTRHGSGSEYTASAEGGKPGLKGEQRTLAFGESRKSAETAEERRLRRWTRDTRKSDGDQAMRASGQSAALSRRLGLWIVRAG